MNKAIIIVIVLLVLAVLIGAVYYYQNYYQKPQEKGFTPTVPLSPKVSSGSGVEEIKVGADINPVENMPATNPLEGANPFGGGGSNPFEE